MIFIDEHYRYSIVHCSFSVQHLRVKNAVHIVWKFLVFLVTIIIQLT
jgi:hypothetical protein